MGSFWCFCPRSCSTAAGMTLRRRQRQGPLASRLGRLVRPRQAMAVGCLGKPERPQGRRELGLEVRELEGQARQGRCPRKEARRVAARAGSPRLAERGRERGRTEGREG